jgi:hypothetical protein
MMGEEVGTRTMGDVGVAVRSEIPQEARSKARRVNDKTFFIVRFYPFWYGPVIRSTEGYGHCANLIIRLSTERPTPIKVRVSLFVPGPLP